MQETMGITTVSGATENRIIINIQAISRIILTLDITEINICFSKEKGPWH